MECVEKRGFLSGNQDDFSANECVEKEALVTIALKGLAITMLKQG